jgi:hypothetical protein
VEPGRGCTHRVVCGCGKWMRGYGKCVREQSQYAAHAHPPHAPGISPLLGDLRLVCPASEFEFEAEAGVDGDREGGVSAT